MNDTGKARINLMAEFEWENGCWKNENSAATDARVLIASDWAPIRAFDTIIRDDPEAVYGDLLPEIRQSDFRIVNLECPLTSLETPVWKSGSVLKGAPDHVRGLTAAPFEVATLGNNHIFDYGVEAFQQTRMLLTQAGIRTVGAGMSAEEARAPVVVDVNSLRLAVISFSEGEDLTTAGTNPGVFGWQVEEVLAGIDRIRQSVDIVIVICHCGVEYIPFPPPYVAEAFHRLADGGADLVVGHHPHVPQGVQIHNGVPICYSMGNFVFYQDTDLHYRKIGYLIRASLGKGAVTQIELIPYDIRPTGLGLLKDENRRRFFEKLKEVSLPLADAVSIERAWHGFLRWCGVGGFFKEIDMLMEKLKNEPEKGAAMFRNRITTPQHHRHWIDAMTRIIEGRIESSPWWAYELTREWMTAKIQ